MRLLENVCFPVNFKISQTILCGLNSEKGVKVNSGGTTDVYFGPKVPKGKESNWIQTVPGKGWNTLLRLYGPLQSWFDKSWKPGEIKMIE